MLHQSYSLMRTSSSLFQHSSLYLKEFSRNLCEASEHATETAKLHQHTQQKKGKYELKQYHSPIVSQNRGQGCGLQRYLYETQPCVEFDKDEYPMLSLGNINRENGNEKSWPENKSVGLVSYDGMIDLPNHEMQACGNLLSMNLHTGQIFCVKFAIGNKNVVLNKQEIHDKYSVELPPRDVDDPNMETILAREELIKLFEKRAEASWIAESMFIAPMMYCWDPLRWQYVNKKDDETISKVVHPALIIVSQGIDGKYYPFAIPMSCRDDVDTINTVPSEYIPLDFKACAGNFVKYNKYANKVCILQHNLCPRLATTIPSYFVSAVYDNTTDWKIKYPYSRHNALRWHGLRPIDPELASQVDKIKSGGPLPDSIKINMKEDTDFFPMFLKQSLKHSIKNILIKTISFHIQRSATSTHKSIGGLKSIHDLNGMTSDQFSKQQRRWQEKQQFAQQCQENERLIQQLDI